MGEHEHFLIERLDGALSIEEIEAQFAEHFERTLTPALWASLFSLLGARGLLVGSDDPVLMDRLRDARASQLDDSRTLAHARMPFLRADRLLDALSPLAQALDRPAVWVSTWVGALALLGYLISQWDQVWTTARSAWTQPAAVIMVMAVLWATILLHEIGHGVTARLYGARDIEIGIMWRLPLLIPYCKVDDTVLFHDRMQRVRVALAGPTISVALCLPFVIPHLATGGEGLLGTVAAAIIAFGLFSGLLNLIPVLKMDGYYAMAHLLQIRDLEGSAQKELLALLRRGGGPRGANPLRPLYLAYGIFTVALYTAFAAAAAVFGISGLSPLVGTGPAALIVIVVVGAAVATALIVSRRSRRHLAQLPGTQAPAAPERTKWGTT
ncbi:metalloprotease [Brachybacterium sp. DNPG3]